MGIGAGLAEERARSAVRVDPVVVVAIRAGALGRISASEEPLAGEALNCRLVRSRVSDKCAGSALGRTGETVSHPDRVEPVQAVAEGDRTPVESGTLKTEVDVCFSTGVTVRTAI